MNRFRNTRVALTVCLALGLGACGGKLAPPVQLTPVGDIAWYANHALAVVDTLQQVAIDGESAGVISRNDARRIVEATKAAGLAGVDLHNALAAGADAVTARNRAVAIIRRALSDLPNRLSPHAASLVRPYVSAVLTLLTVFS